MSQLKSSRILPKYYVYVVAAAITVVGIAYHTTTTETFMHNCKITIGKVEKVDLHGSGKYNVIEYTYEIGSDKYRSEGSWPGSQNPCEEGVINCDSAAVCYSQVNPSRSILVGSKNIVEAKIDD